jgi:hypothetical protein
MLATMGMRRITPRELSAEIRPPSRSLAVERLDAGQRTGVLGHAGSARCGVTVHRDRRGAQAVLCLLGGTGHHQHRRRQGHGLGQLRVVRGQRTQCFGQRAVFHLGLGQQPLGRQRIGLGHQDVDADGRGLGTLQDAHQARQHVARPGPLADLEQALLVDGHHRDRQRRHRARPQGLVGIEPGAVQPFDPGAVESDHQHQGQQQGRADQANPARPAGRRLRRAGLRTHKGISSPS